MPFNFSDHWCDSRTSCGIERESLVDIMWCVAPPPPPPLCCNVFLLWLVTGGSIPKFAIPPFFESKIDGGWGGEWIMICSHGNPFAAAWWRQPLPPPKKKRCLVVPSPLPLFRWVHEYEWRCDLRVPDSSISLPPTHCGRMFENIDILNRYIYRWQLTSSGHTDVVPLYVFVGGWGWEGGVLEACHQWAVWGSLIIQ